MAPETLKARSKLEWAKWAGPLPTPLSTNIIIFRIEIVFFHRSIPCCLFTSTSCGWAVAPLCVVLNAMPSSHEQLRLQFDGYYILHPLGRPQLLGVALGDG